MKAVKNLLVISGVSLLATSCATFPNNRLAKIPDTATSKAKKVSLTYSYKAGHDLTGSRTEFAPATIQSLEQGFTKTLDNSGRFSSVKNGKGGVVQVDVDMLNHGNGTAAFASGFISGFSLFTIPGFAVDNYKLTATARASSGKSRQYVLEDGATTTFWLPLIVATPFCTPTSVIPKVQENMYRHLMQNMENDGILPK